MPNPKALVVAVLFALKGGDHGRILFDHRHGLMVI